MSDIRFPLPPAEVAELVEAANLPPTSQDFADRSMAAKMRLLDHGYVLEEGFRDELGWPRLALRTQGYCAECGEPVYHIGSTFCATHDTHAQRVIIRAAKPQPVRFVNLTPHVIVVQIGSERVSFAPVAPAVRVGTERAQVRDLWLDDANSIPLFASHLGQVENLPEPEEGVVYIVSLVALSAIKQQFPERSDCVAPGTGPDDGAIRYSDGPRKGQVEAVTCFVC